MVRIPRRKGGQRGDLAMFYYTIPGRLDDCIRRISTDEGP